MRKSEADATMAGPTDKTINLSWTIVNAIAYGILASVGVSWVSFAASPREPRALAGDSFLLQLLFVLWSAGHYFLVIAPLLGGAFALIQASGRFTPQVHPLLIFAAMVIAVAFSGLVHWAAMGIAVALAIHLVGTLNLRRRRT